MTSVTARRRGSLRVDARRRQGAGRGASVLPSLFDAAPAVPSTPTARVELDDSGGGGLRAGRIEAGEREATVATGSGETLDRLVVSSWERLVSHADAPCLLCGGTMEPRYGAHAAPIGGRCRDCGTTLA
jgi:hypothetical protein